jgi:hypothetical protein
MRRKPVPFYAIAHGLLAMPLLLRWAYDAEPERCCEDQCGETNNNIKQLDAEEDKGDGLKEWEGRL